MKYNQFGRTGLFVSEICLGTMTFGGNGNAGMMQFAGMAHIPAFQVVRVHFGVELQSQRKLSHGKCLVRITVRTGQQECALRQVEGVAVPVEDG